MANILCIDTSTDICSVILGNEERVIAQRVSYQEREHSKIAGVFVDEILKEAAQMGIAQPDAIAVCSGPGSYTGLRIGVSLAKGLCFGYDIPLIGIDSLQVMVHEIVTHHKDIEGNAVLCPMIDARRMEVYSSLWKSSGELIGKPEAVIVDENSYVDFLNQPFYYFGTGAEKCQEVLKNDNAQFISGLAPMAAYLLPPALDAFHKEQFEDVAYFEPFYLKQFQTTVSKKNVLGL